MKTMGFGQECRSSCWRREGGRERGNLENLVSHQAASMRKLVIIMCDISLEPTGWPRTEKKV